MGIVLALALLLPGVLAIGIAPASSEHNSFVDNTILVRLKVLNPAGQQMGALLSAEGELAQYMNFPEQVVVFEKGEGEHWVTIELEVPDDLEPGQYESRILVTSAPIGTGTFSARLQVVHRLSLFVDYPEFYIKADVVVPDFKVGEEGVFELFLRNKGEHSVEASIDAWVGIPGTPTAERLPRSAVSLPVGAHSTIRLPWTPEWFGEYVFAATVSYANTSRNISQPFEIGTPLLTPESAVVRPVPLGEVLPITLGITSNWNVPIEAVHAWVQLRQNDTMLLETRTVSEDIAPRGMVELPIYIETASLDYGTYILEMDLVSDRTRDTYFFELELAPKGVTLTPTGFVITLKQETLSERLGKPSAFAAVVVILLAVVLFGYVMKRRKSKD